MKQQITMALIFSWLIALSSVIGQPHTDYIGAGHNIGITVTSSSDHQRNGWSQTASAEKTINGAGMEGKLSEAARFLTQSAIRHDIQEIEHVAEVGIEAWIDEQIAQPPVFYLPLFENTLAEYIDFQLSIGIPDSLVEKREIKAIQVSTYWRMNMLERDFLRDKIALAWSEIMVLSTNSVLNPYGRGLMNYLDVFKRNAFGNFEDILKEVSLHTSMGWFLSHYANQKEDLEAMTFPDENFAREVMQLFSIGLYELNNDGSFKLDSSGELITTYDQSDIQQMAKIFTGLGAGGSAIPTISTSFALPQWAVDFAVPMIMYQEHHDATEKVLFDRGLIIPAGQQGMEDINMTIDYLFNHSNTPPFICQRLIQLFVKSNPSPEYVERVSNIFINDGSDVRGNMEAVIKGILLDEEARSCDWQNHPTQGKLKNPTEKYIQFTQVVDIVSERDEIWMDGQLSSWTTEHLPLAAPSVFNFHERDFVPNGEIADAGLVAPEFQLLNTQTSMGAAALNDRWFHNFNRYGRFGSGVQDSILAMHPEFDRYYETAQDNEVLINALDLRLTNGNLSPFTRSILKNLLDGMKESDFPNASLHLGPYIDEKIKHAIALIMLSPDFNILK